MWDFSECVIVIVIVIVSGQPWFLTADPFIEKTMVFAEFFRATEQQAFRRVIAKSRIVLDREQMACAFSWVCTSPSAVNTTVGFLDLRKVPVHLRLIVCVDAPESTTNSRPSGLFEVSASITFSFFWSIVALDRRPTHKSIRGLCKACLAIGQLAFLREVERLRTDPSHERTRVTPLTVHNPSQLKSSFAHHVHRGS